MKKGLPLSDYDAAISIAAIMHLKMMNHATHTQMEKIHRRIEQDYAINGKKGKLDFDLIQAANKHLDNFGTGEKNEN